MKALEWWLAAILASPWLRILALPHAVSCVEDGGDAISEENARIMVVGDSISHGHHHDATWRWRLFAWIQDTLGRKPHFVGPWAGTFGHVTTVNAKPNPPLFPGETAPYDYTGEPGQYAESVPEYFASGHFHASKWGMQAAQVKNTINAWVTEHQPDYLILMLGFNDLGWWVSTPEGLQGDIGSIIENARQAKANLKILVANVVHRTFLAGRQDLVDNTNRYNQILRQNVQGWWVRLGSPLAYVDVNSYYQCTPHSGCPDAYDGLHPNGLGEYHIAQAFADALEANFGYIGNKLNIPANFDNSRPIGVPTNIIVVSVPEGIRSQWAIGKNARGYDVRYRLQGMSSWWSEGPVSPFSFVHVNPWVVGGQVWEAQVRTVGNDGAVSGWSVVGGSGTTEVQTAPGPPNIVANPVGGDGLVISWGAVTGYSVNRYAVLIWDRDEPGAWVETRPVLGTTLSISGLRSGHRYSTWVSTYINLGGKPAGGLPAGGRDVFVGRGAPPTPTNLGVVDVDPTTVRLEWSGSANAVGYGVYLYRVADGTAAGGGDVGGATSYGIAYLFPGTWNYRFCVSAYNGNLESSRTAVCVVPPRYPGFKGRGLTYDNGTSFTTGNSTFEGNLSNTVSASDMFEDQGFRMLVKQMMVQEAAVAKDDTVQF